MATINDITNAASYRGDAALGAFLPDAIQIDTKPIEDLAKYTVVYNQAEYTQRQKDAEERARELAQIAALDFSKIDTKWREPISEKYDALIKYVKENPNVFNYQKNPKGYLEYKRLKDETNQAVTNGGANQVLLEGRRKTIADNPDVQLKSIMQKTLDEDVANTGLDSSLPVEQKFDLSFPKIPAPAQVTLDVLVTGENGVTKKTHTLTDYGDIINQSNLISFDDHFKVLDKTSSEYINASPEDKKRIDTQEKYRNLVSTSGWRQAGVVLNAALNDPKYVTDGKVDPAKILSDPTLSQYVSIFETYNKNAATQLSNIQSGYYNDKDGKNVIPQKLLDPRNYTSINWQDGITDKELTMALMGATAAAQKEATDFKYTGEGNTKLNILTDAATARRGQDLELQRARITQAGETERARIAANAKALGRGGGGKSDVPEADYSPLQSIAAGAGALNKAIAASSLSVAQLAAINPSWIDEKGQIKKDNDGKLITDGISVSVGTIGNDKNNYGVFILGQSGKANGDGINESKLLSNGASYLTQYDKERKGQDAYAFKQDAYEKAIGKAVKIPDTPKVQSDIPSGSKSDFKAAGWTDSQIQLAVKAGKIKIN